MRVALLIGATALSAGIYSLAFPPLRWRPLAFVCLVPFLVALRHVGWRGALALGFVWGNVAAVFVADALRASAEIYFLQSPIVSWVFTAGVYTLTSAVYYAGFGVMYRGLAARPGPALPMLAAAAWVAAELVRARLFTGSAFWGNPWALIGYSQVGVDPLVQVASLGGIFAVGFVLVAPNAALADLWLARGSRRERVRAGLGLAVALLPALAAWGYGISVLRDADRASAETDAVPVAIVQANVDLGSQWRREFYGRNLKQFLALTREVARESGPAVVVWPESALTFHLENEASFRLLIAEELAESDLELVVGGPSGVDGPPPVYFNSVFLVDGSGKVRGRYDKRRLVPFAEYLPLAGLDLVKRRFDTVRVFSPGAATPPLPTRAGPAGVLVCNEGMLADAGRERVLEGAEWLVSPSNDSWIAKPKWAELTFDLVSVRAIELRRYLVRGSSSGPSGIVDPWGRVLARTHPKSRTLVTGAIRPRSDRTLYARFGDLFGLLCGLAVAARLALRRRSRPSAP